MSTRPRHASDPLRRRDLFRPRSTDRLANPAAEPLGQFDLIRARRDAMGSYFEVRIPAATPGGFDLVNRSLDVVDDLEARLTVYRDDSEVARLNATAHLGPVAVSAELFGLLETAVAIGRATGGAYDVASGALSLAWGFTRGPRRVPTPEELADALDRTGQRHLALDPERRTVAFDRTGVVINLGSIGKGFAVDRAADAIRSHWWPTSALIHGGRSSIYALGSPPGRFAGRWPVALHDPTDPERSLGTIRIRERGMATSGATYQRFEQGDRTYGHLIDPRTGEPPEFGPASVTVLAPTAAEADALSTAFSLAGFDEANRFAADRPDIGAIFVELDPDSGMPATWTINLSDSDFTPTPPDSARPQKFRPLTRVDDRPI